MEERLTKLFTNILKEINEDWELTDEEIKEQAQDFVEHVLEEGGEITIGYDPHCGITIGHNEW